ncbi:hypothetical protein [Streptomyces sp. YGL11-2]|uniref:hypothetical protein n=1 Tax=Streptomyces sp. YGL11-2 TaxID=3414028 RepID=UPI003CF4AA45
MVGQCAPGAAGTAEREPVPREGCDVCQALHRQRESARRAGHPRTVRSRNAEIAAHPHEGG